MREVTTALAARQADDNERLERANRQLKQALDELRCAYADTVMTLAAAVEARDQYTGGHIQRCGRLSGIIAAELGLSAQEQDYARLAGALHDVGKVGVPDAILH